MQVSLAADMRSMLAKAEHRIDQRSQEAGCRVEQLAKEVAEVRHDAGKLHSQLLCGTASGDKVPVKGCSTERQQGNHSVDRVREGCCDDTAISEVRQALSSVAAGVVKLAQCRGFVDSPAMPWDEDEE